MEDLAYYREQIDEIDKSIVTLLSSRINVCKLVAALKHKENIPMMQPERIIQVIEHRKTMAIEQGISPIFIDQLYKIIIDEMCRIEDEIIDKLSH